MPWRVWISGLSNGLSIAARKPWMWTRSESLSGNSSPHTRVSRSCRVTTDGLASYDSESLGQRSHEAKVQTRAERRDGDAVQSCHWTISLLKRWLLGTHAGAVSPKHLQAYLDEYAFRHNRRRTNGVGRIAARVIERLVARQPLTMRSLIDDTRPCRWFRQPELTA